MEAQPRTLGSVLSGLVNDPADRAAYNDDPDGFLAERGFPGLSDRALGEAVCQVADTLPAPVAEQLAPEVMALQPLTTAEYATAEAPSGLEALQALADVPVHDLDFEQSPLDHDLAPDDHDLDDDALGGITGAEGSVDHDHDDDGGDDDLDTDLDTDIDLDTDFDSGEPPAVGTTAARMGIGDAGDDLQDDLDDGADHGFGAGLGGIISHTTELVGADLASADPLGAPELDDLGDLDELDDLDTLDDLDPLDPVGGLGRLDGLADKLPDDDLDTMLRGDDVADVDSSLRPVEEPAEPEPDWVEELE